MSIEELPKDNSEFDHAKVSLVEPHLRPYFKFGLAFVQDTATVNERLIAAGRPDLVIYRPAKMVDVKTPDDAISMGPVDQDPGEYHPLAPVGINFFKQLQYRGDHGSRPINREEVEGLADGSYTPKPTIARTEVKKAIARLLSIPELSEFTKDTILKLSDGESHTKKSEHKQEVFMLLSLASELVCTEDEGVVMPNGSINEHYLVF